MAEFPTSRVVGFWDGEEDKKRFGVDGSKRILTEGGGGCCF